jgi:hypothetical protein
MHSKHLVVGTVHGVYSYIYQTSSHSFVFTNVIHDFSNQDLGIIRLEVLDDDSIDVLYKLNKLPSEDKRSWWALYHWYKIMYCTQKHQLT